MWFNVTSTFSQPFFHWSIKLTSNRGSTEKPNIGYGRNTWEESTIGSGEHSSISAAGANRVRPVHCPPRIGVTVLCLLYPVQSQKKADGDLQSSCVEIDSQFDCQFRKRGESNLECKVVAAVISSLLTWVIIYFSTPLIRSTTTLNFSLNSFLPYRHGGSFFSVCLTLLGPLTAWTKNCVFLDEEQATPNPFSTLPMWAIAFLAIASAAPFIKKTNYDETEARMLLNLAAAAYGVRHNDCIAKFVFYLLFFTASVPELSRSMKREKFSRLINKCVTILIAHVKATWVCHFVNFEDFLIQLHPMPERSSFLSSAVQRQKLSSCWRDGTLCSLVLTSLTWEMWVVFITVILFFRSIATSWMLISNCGPMLSKYYRIQFIRTILVCLLVILLEEH